MRAFTPGDNPAPSGIIDRFIRRFPRTAHLAAGVILYAVATLAVGMAAAVPLGVASAVGGRVATIGSWIRWPALGALVATSFFLWGLALLIVVPGFNFALPTRLRAFSGGYFTAASLPWYLHNGLFYLVRFTVLPFVTATPIGTLFLRAMGMKMGRRVHITSEFFSDVNMITIGDDAVIGGSATVFCHYGGNGRLVIAPVVIGRGAVIGEKATIMGDVVVGEGATVLPHAAVLPGTRIGPRERWGGAPARRISREEWEAMKASRTEVNDDAIPSVAI
ncbi:MAG: hypothetical protein IT356_10010 [Gemmatimonadaceae bacterium]|nr:hypothetical protein [Gemmatimonadaceae bacterium]